MRTKCITNTYNQMKQKTDKNPKGAGAPKKAPTKMVRIPIEIEEDVTKLKEKHLKLHKYENN